MQPTKFGPEQSASAALAQMAHMVLVIDDDAMQREILTSLLTRAGHASVLTASDGKDALERMAAYGAQIGLVVCDLQMPGMDGMELLQIGRAHV